MNKAYLASLTDHSLRGKTGFEIDKSIEPDIAALWKEVEKIGVPDGGEGLEDLLVPAKRGRK
jgi:hypothetical protein